MMNGYCSNDFSNADGETKISFCEAWDSTGNFDSKQFLSIDLSNLCRLK